MTSTRGEAYEVDVCLCVSIASEYAIEMTLIAMIPILLTSSVRMQKPNIWN